MLLPLEQAGKQAAGTAQARASLERHSKRLNRRNKPTSVQLLILIALVVCVVVRSSVSVAKPGQAGCGTSKVRSPTAHYTQAFHKQFSMIYFEWGNMLEDYAVSTK